MLIIIMDINVIIIMVLFKNQKTAKLVYTTIQLV